MEALYASVPFAAAVTAVAMLIAGFLRVRPVLFVASLAVLFLACGLALASGAVPGAAPAFLMVFGAISIVLSARVRPGAFVSRGGLRVIGVFLFVLGVVGLTPSLKTRSNESRACVKTPWRQVG